MCSPQLRSEVRDLLLACLILGFILSRQLPDKLLKLADIFTCHVLCCKLKNFNLGRSTVNG